MRMPGPPYIFHQSPTLVSQLITALDSDSSSLSFRGHYKWCGDIRKLLFMHEVKIFCGVKNKKDPFNIFSEHSSPNNTKKETKELQQTYDMRTQRGLPPAQTQNKRKRNKETKEVQQTYDMRTRRGLPPTSRGGKYQRGS